MRSQGQTFGFMITRVCIAFVVLGWVNLAFCTPTLAERIDDRAAKMFVGNQNGDLMPEVVIGSSSPLGRNLLGTRGRKLLSPSVIDAQHLLGRPVRRLQQFWNFFSYNPTPNYVWSTPTGNTPTTWWSTTPQGNTQTTYTTYSQPSQVQEVYSPPQTSLTETVSPLAPAEQPAAPVYYQTQWPLPERAAVQQPVLASPQDEQVPNPAPVYLQQAANPAEEPVQTPTPVEVPAPTPVEKPVPPALQTGSAPPPLGNRDTKQPSSPPKEQPTPPVTPAQSVSPAGEKDQQQQQQQQQSTPPAPAAASTSGLRQAGEDQEKKSYCIPYNRTTAFNVLAAGDSITQGSVPSKNLNHPYAVKLEELLQGKLETRRVRVEDAGLGGGGLFQTGFSINKMFPEYYRENLNKRRWNVVVIMIGINDLLRGATPADNIMAALQILFDETLAQGLPIIAIPPFAAPAFVPESDQKEIERKKLAGLLAKAAEQRASSTGGEGPQIFLLDLQSGPMDFYKMSPEERSKWLDDGLHMTEYAYDQLGQYVFDNISQHMCELPAKRLADFALDTLDAMGRGLFGGFNRNREYP